MIIGMIDPETGEGFTCGLGRETCNDTSDCGGGCERFGFCEAEVRPSSSRLRPGDVLPVPHTKECWTVVSVEAGDYSVLVNPDGSRTEHSRVGSATMRHADGSETVNPFHNGSTIVHSINLVAIRREERKKRERRETEKRELEEMLCNRTCAVGFCEERVGVVDRHVCHCPEHHSEEESTYETDQVVRLREELDELQGSILNLAGVALAPYVRALRALDDSRRVLAVAQDANGESYDESPDLLERIVVYEGEVEVEGRGEADEDWAPARARAQDSSAEVKRRLGDLKRLRRKVATQAIAAGLESRIQAALVYAGVDEGERGKP